QAPTGSACVPGPYHEFFSVVQESVAWFSDPGQGGPPDNDIEAWIDLQPAPAPPPPPPPPPDGDMAGPIATGDAGSTGSADGGASGAGDDAGSGGNPGVGGGGGDNGGANPPPAQNASGGCSLAGGSDGARWLAILLL